MVRHRRRQQKAGHSREQRGEQEDVHLRRVVERQGSELRIAARDIEHRDAAHVMAHQRPVGHHRALRRGRRAGRVEDLRDRVVVDVLIDRRHLLVGGDHLEQADLLAVDRALDGAEEGGAQRRADRRQRAGESRIVEDRARAALLEDVGQLFAGEREVDRHVDEPGAAAGEKEDGVDVGVLPERRHPITRRQPEIDEPLRHAVHRGIESAEGPVPLVEHQRGLVRAPRHRPAQAVADGVACHASDAGVQLGHGHPPGTSLVRGPRDRINRRRSGPGAAPSRRLPHVRRSSAAETAPRRRA